MRKKLRDNKGSITSVTAATVLFFFVILSTAYMVTSTNRKTQIKSELVAKETYESSLNNIDAIREEVTGLPKTDETQPYFPSSNFTRVEGTNLENGLVIEDGEGNQYVWVVVPRTTKVYPTAGLNIVNFTDSEYTKIENDLHTYTSVYRNNTTYSDTWAADTANEGWFSESEYNALKKKMLKSIYQNGGFYVGRYEAGIGINRTSNTDKNSDNKYTTPTTVPVTQANAYPYTYVTRTQAQNLAKNVNSGDKTCSLMFGVQWDLVLAFMHNKGNIADNVLISNSKTIGNFENSAFKLNSLSKYATISNWGLSSTWNSAKTATTNFVDSSLNKIAQSIEGNGILVTTGTSEQNKVMNIYDIAGNVMEWTLEKKSSSPCVDRGGVCYDMDTTFPASIRYEHSSGDSLYSIGFRVSLW